MIIHAGNRTFPWPNMIHIINPIEDVRELIIRKNQPTQSTTRTHS